MEITNDPWNIINRPDLCCFHESFLRSSQSNHKVYICCKSFWQSSPKATGQRWAWCWTDWHQSNIDKHCRGFVSPTENGGMHGTAFDVSFSLQVISMHLHYNTSTSWIFLTCVLTNPFARMLGACGDSGAKQLRLLFFVSCSPSWEVAAEIFSYVFRWPWLF